MEIFYAHNSLLHLQIHIDCKQKYVKNTFILALIFLLPTKLHSNLYHEKCYQFKCASIVSLTNNKFTAFFNFIISKHHYLSNIFDLLEINKFASKCELHCAFIHYKHMYMNLHVYRILLKTSLNAYLSMDLHQ